jgi:hypothetical protein
MSQSDDHGSRTLGLWGATGVGVGAIVGGGVLALSFSLVTARSVGRSERGRVAMFLMVPYVSAIAIWPVETVLPFRAEAKCRNV